MRDFGWRLGATLLFAGLAILVPEPPLRAQTAAELASARALFTEALADENNGYFETALGKFERVQQVKDTANVRYRIATCYEGLGKRAKALAAYRSVLEVAEGDKTAKDAVAASRERIEQLERVVARLTIVLPPKAPPDAEVWLDDEKVDPRALGSEISVDAGAHTIAASGKDMPPFRTQVSLPEGGRVAVTVPVEAPPPSPPATAGPPAPSASASASAAPPASGEPPARGSDTRTLGWVAIGAGAAFVAASGVTLALRQHDINTIQSACFHGACPTNRRDELTSAHDRAVLEGPLAAGLAAVGVAAAALGVYFVVRPDGATEPRGQAAKPSIGVAPVLSPREAGLGVRGTF